MLVEPKLGTKIFAVVVGSIFVFLGMFFLKYLINNNKQIDKLKEQDRNTKEVLAEVEKLGLANGRHVTYFSYKIDGKEYNNVPIYGYGHLLEKGEKVYLYYDSRNPNKIYPENNREKIKELEKNNPKFVIGVIACIFFGGLAIVAGLFGKVVEKDC